MPLRGTKTENLGAGLKIFVSDAHVITSDALLLADFAKPGKKDKVCDLGTGCGIIPIIWNRDFSPSCIKGIEISKIACALFNNTLETNGLCDKIQCINADIRHLEGVVDFEYFDLVSINPPYKKQGAGIVSENEERKNARHEFCCSLEDALGAAGKLLKYGGSFAVCHRPERLCDLFHAMRKYGIEPKRLREVVQRRGAEPSLILAEGRKGGSPGLRISPVLYIEDENGHYSEEAAKIFYAHKRIQEGDGHNENKENT